MRAEQARDDKFELHHGFVVAFAGGTIEHGDIAYRVRKLAGTWRTMTYDDDGVLLGGEVIALADIYGPLDVA